jgi:hypothetical protein
MEEDKLSVFFSVANSQGIKIYNYDDFGRLKTTKDHNENILQFIEYNYKNTPE